VDAKRLGAIGGLALHVVAALGLGFLAGELFDAPGLGLLRLARLARRLHGRNVVILPHVPHILSALLLGRAPIRLAFLRLPLGLCECPLPGGLLLRLLLRALSLLRGPRLPFPVLRQAPARMGNELVRLFRGPGAARAVLQVMARVGAAFQVRQIRLSLGVAHGTLVDMAHQAMRELLVRLTGMDAARWGLLQGVRGTLLGAFFGVGHAPREISWHMDCTAGRQGAGMTADIGFIDGLPPWR
jgi:hypothetical protein